MKGIIKGVGMIVFAGAVVAGGTGAFFSDTETSTANIFTAGAIDLKVDSVAHINGLVCFDDGEVSKWLPEDVVSWNASTSANTLTGDAEAAIAIYNAANPSNVPQAGAACTGTWEMTDLGPTNTFFNYGDLKPGDNGENTISLHVVNNDAYMCATISNVNSAENTMTEPEAAVDTSSTTGELDQELSFFIWEDDGDNIFEQGEQVLASNEDGVGIEGTYPLYTPQTNAIKALETSYVGVYWCYGDLTVSGTNLSCNGSSVTNVSQTDSLKADISFYIEQARNNGNFRCPGTVDQGPTTATTTVDKVVTFTSGTIVGVDVNDFALTIDGPGDPISVTDEIPKGNLAPGVYTISEAYSGNPAGITYEATFSGACSEIGNTNTGTMTVNAGDNLVCTITNSVSPAPVVAIQ